MVWNLSGVWGKEGSLFAYGGCLLQRKSEVLFSSGVLFQTLHYIMYHLYHHHTHFYFSDFPIVHVDIALVGGLSMSIADSLSR